MFQNYHPVNVSAISLKGIPLLETHLTVNTTQPKKVINLTIITVKVGIFQRH